MTHLRNITLYRTALNLADANSGTLTSFPFRFEIHFKNRWQGVAVLPSVTYCLPNGNYNNTILTDLAHLTRVYESIFSKLKQKNNTTIKL